MMDDDDLATMLAGHESAGAPRFTVGFADRVMTRVAEAAGGRAVLTLERALARQAQRLIPTLAAASLVLALWNWWSVRDRAPSTLGAVLGIVASTGSSGEARSPAGVGLVNTEVFE